MPPIAQKKNSRLPDCPFCMGEYHGIRFLMRHTRWVPSGGSGVLQGAVRSRQIPFRSGIKEVDVLRQEVDLHLLHAVSGGRTRRLLSTLEVRKALLFPLLKWGLTNPTHLHIITKGNYMEMNRMDIQTIKAMFDACYQAKRIRELLPPLPAGVTPSYIHFLDTIETLERQGTRVKVSDISDALQIPRPGVTRTVKEMEAKGYLYKNASPRDGRITYISATEAGKRLSQIYDEQYFDHLAPLLSGISQEEADCTIQTIQKFYRVMSEGGISVSA